MNPTTQEQITDLQHDLSNLRKNAVTNYKTVLKVLQALQTNAHVTKHRLDALTKGLAVLADSLELLEQAHSHHVHVHRSGNKFTGTPTQAR